MITGESDPATASVAMRYGAVDFIVKPIETHDLISRIRSVMQNALAV
jgi:FixJ family two-component response regulator